jgi:hypothetical protein
LSDYISKKTTIGVFELYKSGKSLFKPFVDEIEKDGNLLVKLNFEK